MKRLNFWTLLAVIMYLLIAVPGTPVFADFGDEATLGGLDTSGNYRWRVTSDGNLIPGTDSDVDIGDSTHKPENIFADYFQFQTSIYASGHSSGATTLVSQVTPLTSAHIAFALVRLENGSPGEHVLPAGVTGKVVIFELVNAGTYVLGADTKTGWVNIALYDAGDRITLLWPDDTTGWIIAGNDGCTITY